MAQSLGLGADRCLTFERPPQRPRTLAASAGGARTLRRLRVWASNTVMVERSGPRSARASRRLAGQAAKAVGRASGPPASRRCTRASGWYSTREWPAG